MLISHNYDWTGRRGKTELGCRLAGARSKKLVCMHDTVPGTLVVLKFTYGVALGIVKKLFKCPMLKLFRSLFCQRRNTL
jgi:hypothetical protein